jgi:hypothetical protein
MEIDSLWLGTETYWRHFEMKGMMVLDGWMMIGWFGCSKSAALTYRDGCTSSCEDSWVAALDYRA